MHTELTACPACLGATYSAHAARGDNPVFSRWCAECGATGYSPCFICGCHEHLTPGVDGNICATCAEECATEVLCSCGCDRVVAIVAGEHRCDACLDAHRVAQLVAEREVA